MPINTAKAAHLVTFGFLAILFYPVMTQAETIEIEADSLLLDENEGVAKYRGNVVFKKNRLSITAETITVYQQSGKISKALITGEPANIRHEPENEAPANAVANRVEFDAKTEKLLLLGNAYVVRDKQQFSGEKIEYDARKKSLVASGQETIIKNQEESPAPRRVHVIIGPADKSAGNE